MLPLTVLWLFAAVFGPGIAPQESADASLPRAVHLPGGPRRPPFAEERVLPKMPEGVGGIGGFVDIEIVVGADGRVAHARVSKPLDDRLDREALLAARKWRFRPATTGDRPIPMLMVLRVKFDSARSGTADAVSADVLSPPRFTPPSADLFALAVEVGPKNPGARHPQLIRNIIPSYTPEGLRAKIQGIVELQAVVMPDGTVGAVRVVKSLDSQYGLDEQAIQAAARWFFEPGTLNGTPVATKVTLMLEFRVR